MKLLHEEYVSFDQLLDELPALKAIERSASYFDERDEDSFDNPGNTNEEQHTIMTRYFARKER